MILQITEDIRIDNSGYNIAIQQYKEVETKCKETEEKTKKMDWVTLPSFYTSDIGHAIKKVCQLITKDDVYQDFKQYEKKQLKVLKEISEKFKEFPKEKINVIENEEEL